MKASFQSSSQAPFQASGPPASRPSAPRITAHTPAAFFNKPEALHREPDEANEPHGEGIDGTDEATCEAIRREARAQAGEIITRFLVWIAEGETLSQRGMRATVALYCTRPDLIDWRSLSQIGETGDRTEQAVHKLARQFRATMNLKH